MQRRYLASEDIEARGIYQYFKIEKWQELIFIVQPAFSWSHLLITESAFRRILASLHVFTPFLRVVHAFGKKTNDKQRARDSAFYHIQSSSAYEFCYNIRYFELHGRGRGNPWSLRQTGVYQRCLPSNQQSTWLILNYSSYIFDRVSMAFEKKRSQPLEACRGSVLTPHLFILSAATRNWGQYVEILRQRVMVFEEKAYSSRIDESFPDDYRLLFSDVQAMVLLEDTVATARAVIRGQRDAIYKCGSIHTELHRRVSKRCGCETASTLETLKIDLQHYHEAIVGLVQTTSKVTSLLTAILATRANGDLRAATNMIQTGITELQQQSRHVRMDTASLLEITTKGHKDALTIKVLAQIATMFLPASLITSIFSSEILGNSSNYNSHVRLYFAITIPVLLLTLLVVILLEKGFPRYSWLF